MTLLLLLAVLPMPGVTCDRVDVIEVNHVFDAQGKPVLTQLIFYDWRPCQSEYDVRTWRLLKHCDHRPELDRRSGEWVARWHDGDVLREVRSTAFRESWTQYDVERIERERLPQEWRVDLTKPQS